MLFCAAGFQERNYQAVVGIFRKENLDTTYSSNLHYRWIGFQFLTVFFKPRLKIRANGKHANV